MIRDFNGDELTYWPISGLLEGQMTEPIVIQIDVPYGPSFLTATRDDRIAIWATVYLEPTEAPPRFVDPAIDITTERYYLGGYAEGQIGAMFTVRLEALRPISALERVPASVSVDTNFPAGWTFPVEPVIDRPIHVRGGFHLPFGGGRD